MTNILPSERIERSILLIRGHKVMLDADLAELYGVERACTATGCKPESKTIPGRFVFQMSKEFLKPGSVSQGMASNGSGRTD